MSAPDPVLRRLALADMDATALVYRASYDERLPWLAGRHTPEQDRWFFRERVFPTQLLTGAFVAGALVGIVAVRADWIDQLYVLPDMQRRGIGTALMRRAQASADRLQLWAFLRNSGARAFYLAHGFTLVRETDGTENEEHEPAAHYLWERRSA